MKCEHCKELRMILRHEMNEANVLAEFIGKKNLCEEYAKWSRPKFVKLDKRLSKENIELLERNNRI
jgi:hypothetical protein